MKLTVLTENTASGKFLAEHGLSYLIEYNGEKVLFDTGHSDVFLKNAKLLNINLDEVETVVLSHGHWDHGNGLKYLKNKKLICHPYAFIKRYRKSDGNYIGLNTCFLDLNKKFKLIDTRKPYYITNEILFLGETPRLNSFESQTTSFMDEYDKDDFVKDDSALVIIKNNELIIVSGCAHSGIVNIIDYAKKTTGVNKVKTVIGGFHLKTNDLQTQKTIAYLKEQNITEIHPSHCTELPALCEIQKSFGCLQIKTGMTFNF